MMTHFRENNILSQQQFGFIPGRSTHLQLLHVLEHWTSILDEGGELDVLYFDFKKAFDTVPHRRLLAKLAALGVSEELYNWIEDFLTNREQTVVVNGKHSGWRRVTSGIPQGSVLGPILFIIYINDLPDVVKSIMLLFADDAKLYREIRSAADHTALQEDVYAMESWSDKWLLRFHPSKCKVMTVCNRAQQARGDEYTLLDYTSCGPATESDL